MEAHHALLANVTQNRCHHFVYPSGTPPALPKLPTTNVTHLVDISVQSPCERFSILTF